MKLILQNKQHNNLLSILNLAHHHITKMGQSKRWGVWLKNSYFVSNKARTTIFPHSSRRRDVKGESRSVRYITWSSSTSTRESCIIFQINLMRHDGFSIMFSYLNRIVNAVRHTTSQILRPVRISPAQDK